MAEEYSNKYNHQYRLIFYVSWIVLYFIVPTWRYHFLYNIFTGEFIESSIGVQYLFVIYFIVAAIYLHLCTRIFSTSRPLKFHVNNLLESIRNNVWLITVCCIATGLQIYSKSLDGIITIHSRLIKLALTGYGIITNYWHNLFDIPIQVPVWSFIILLIAIIRWKKLSGYIADKVSSLYNSNYLMKVLFVLFIIAAFIIYATLFPKYGWQNHIIIRGYPPLGTLLYLGIYLMFGTGHLFLAPLIVQYTFYIMGALFLYKTINLFFDNNTALLGSCLFLFSPLIFAYATVEHIEIGTAFFIIIISYFFLKYVRDGNNEDMILATYFICLGLLYRRTIIVMFLACCLYLGFLKVKRKDLHLRNHLLMLSVAPVSFFPWLFVGNHGATKSNLSYLYSEKLISYLFYMIPSQISWPIFVLLLLSILIIPLMKRNDLVIFFGIVFIGYYALFTIMEQQNVHRYSISFYPAISVFLAYFLYYVSQKLRWKNVFKLLAIIVVIYMAVLSVIPRSSTQLITFKYEDHENQHFPIDDALEWIMNETGENDRVFMPYIGIFLPISKVEIPKDKIARLHLSSDLSSFRQSLKEQCIKQKVSYIMFPGGVARTTGAKQHKEIALRKLLEEDRYDDLIVAAKFNVDDNYIYIYKVRDSFLEN